MVIGVALTSAAWLVTAFVTQPTDETTLRSFYRATRPGGPGWEGVRRRAAAAGEPLPEGRSALATGIACMLLGCVAVYALLFSTGMFLYGHTGAAAGLLALAIIAAAGIRGLWARVGEGT